MSTDFPYKWHLLLFLLIAKIHISLAQSGDPCLDIPASSGLSTTQITYHEARLNVDLTADGFFVRYKKAGTTVWVNAYSLDGGSDATFGLSALEQGSTYEWQVALAFGDLTPGGVNCLSPYSALQSFTTLACLTPHNNDIQVILQSTSNPIQFAYSASGNGFEFRYKSVQEANYTYTGFLETPDYDFSGWTQNTEYQVSFRYKCSQNGNSNWSDWSNDKFFTSPAGTTCAIPALSQMTSDRVDYTSALLSVNALADEYNFRYRPQGEAIIETGFQISKFLVLGGLEADKNYNWQVQVRCGQQITDWSPTASFKTLGCSQLDFKELDVISKAQDALTVKVTSVLSGETYQWRSREKGTSSWIEEAVTTSSQFTIKNLNPGLTYEIQCRLGCSEKYQVYGPWSSSIEASTFSAACPTPGLNDIVILETGYTKALVMSRIEADAYMFQYTRSSFPGSYTPTDELTEPSLELVRLAAGEEYLLQMRIRCGNTWSAWSSDTRFRTAECPDIFQNNMTAEIAGPGSVTFTINQPGKYTGYVWEYAQALAGSVIFMEASRRPILTASGLNSGHNYHWSAKASCPERLGEVFWTNWQEGPDIVTFCEPARKSDIYGDQITKTTARLNCSLSQFSVFEFQYREMNSSAWIPATAPFMASFVDISQLKPNTTYEFQCKFDCADNQSNWSPSQTFTTLKEEETCQTPGIMDFRIDYLSSNAARIRCLVGGGTAYTFRYKRSQETLWFHAGTYPSPFVFLSGLVEDEDYDIQCQVDCGQSGSDWSSVFTFHTELGACGGPALSELNLAGLSDTAAVFQCTQQATAYQFRYRAIHDEDWKFVLGNANGLAAVSDLDPSTVYEVQCRTLCANGPSTWSPSLSFTTKMKSVGSDDGGPVVTEPCYAPDSAQIQINYIGIDEASIRTSFYSDRRYQFRYREVNENSWTLLPASSVPEVILEGLDPAQAYFVAVRVGCSQGVSEWSPRKGFVTLPACDAPEMNQIQTSQDGEEVLLACQSEQAMGYQFRFKLYGDSAWYYSPASVAAEYSIKRVPSDTIIQFQVRISCGAQVSEWSALSEFKTGKLTSVESLEDLISLIYPNPAQSYINISLKDSNRPIKASWWTMEGRKMMEQQFDSSIDVQMECPPVTGMYLLRISDGDKTSWRKVAIQAVK